MKLPSLHDLKLPELGLPDWRLPALAVPRLGLASFRRRIFFRGVFVLLVLATLALALVLLKDEKQRSYQTYQLNFKRTLAEMAAQLRHPAGQLALLNAPGTPSTASPITPLHPLVLPYAALDFDDQNKAQQAVDMTGCSVQYPDGSSLCVAVGNNLYAGGFIYLVGSFDSGLLVGRERGGLALETIHRAQVALDMRGQRRQWVAPLELQPESGGAVRGRLTGFVDTGPALERGAYPVRDFRGWLWQNGACADAALNTADCLRRTFFSIRLPVDVFREALFQKPRPVWPPLDLAQTQVHVTVLAPGTATPVFDSNTPGARAPFSLDDLAQTLLPGETLRLRRLGSSAQDLMLRAGAEAAVPSPWLNWLTRLIQQLPLDEAPTPLSAREVITTPVGSYEISLQANYRNVDRALSVVATRVSGFVAAMLGAIALAWAVIEVGLIRRIAVLTQRAAAVSHNVQDAQAPRRLGDLDLSDLRGADELGILAGGLSDLLQRVKDDVQREQLRAQQERNMWHAVGHEIMSPLQSLMVLHGQPDDASHRYVQRMQQAVRVLYGSASPSEAIEAATLQLGAIDLNAFLGNVASNAHFAGITDVAYTRQSSPVLARADEFSLEDVVTHILTNAQRYRVPGSAITLDLDASNPATAVVRIHNQGTPIAPALMDTLFDYGVSDPETPAGDEHRGQGLFVVKTYMAKMGGTVGVHNVEDGVCFVLTLPRLG